MVDKTKKYGLGIESSTFGKLNIDKSNPLVKSLLSKMVRDNTHNPQNLTKTRQGIEPPDHGWLDGVSNHTTTQINDSLNIFQLLPDTELAQQILISSILSPKDMVNTELNFNIDEDVLDNEISGLLLNVVEDYFNRVYKIKPMLSDILSEVLFTKGSYPLLTLPESSIDDIININSSISVESLKDVLDKNGNLRPMGFLGSPRKMEGKKKTISFENYSREIESSECPIQLSIKKFDSRLSVTDNIDILKMPLVHEKMRTDKIKDIYVKNQISIEHLPEDDKFFKNRHYKLLPIIGVPEVTDKDLESTIGHPLVLKLSPESVIPVHTPGDTSNHIGYFILLDPNGYPITKTKETNYYSEFNNNLNQNKDLVSNLLRTSNRALNGTQQDSVVNPDKITKIYADLIEDNLLRRLKNGVLGEAVEISKPLEVYRVMLARALSNMNTQILFIPSSLMTYIAFDYNRYGVGKSLLEDNKILASIRAMLLFANTMAAIKNSVPHTGLNITLDENDPDPASTVEFLMHEYTKNRQANYPLGASSPMDIINFLQNAGIDLMVTGNKAYPETRMEVEDKNRSIVEPNTELQDILKRDYLMSLGLSPESVDASYSVEFATSIISSNLLLTKRVLLLQEKFSYFLTEFMKTYICFSKTLTTTLKTTMEKNNIPKDKVDKVFKKFLSSFSVSLPKPDTAKLETQMTAYQAYEEALTKALEAYFNPEFLDSISMGDQEEVVNSTLAALKAYFLRKWLRENNVLPELIDLVTVGNDDKPFIDLMKEHADHMENIGSALEEYMLDVAKKREDRAKAMEEKAKKQGIQDVKGDGSSSDTNDEEQEEENLDEMEEETSEDDLGDEEEVEEDMDVDVESNVSTSGPIIQPDDDR